jgi:cell division septum initiation protein DivIVA
MNTRTVEAMATERWELRARIKELEAEVARLTDVIQIAAMRAELAGLPGLATSLLSATEKKP